MSVVVACGGNTGGSLQGDGGGSTGFVPAGSGAAGGSGTVGGPIGASGPGATSTCIVGTQGCLCDSSGGCAPSLTCTQRTPRPSLCCAGSNCTPTGGGIGASCGAATGAASCTPGITLPTASGGNDTCGYSASSFPESTTLCAITAAGGGAQPAIVNVFYNDEHALTLGCATAAYAVSPLPSDPAAVRYPQTGDPACVDAVGRPLRPVLYVTDITADPACTAGDQQHGGRAYDPVAVFGTWKSAAEGAGNVGTPAKQDPTSNKWNLGAGSDPPPSAAMACGERYGAELRFEIGLVSGHSYRFQVIVHDGDQNKGGDSGEACAVFCAGSGSACPQGAPACPGGVDTQCPSGTVCIEGCCLTGGPPPPTTDASVQTTR